MSDLIYFPECLSDLKEPLMTLCNSHGLNITITNTAREIESILESMSTPKRIVIVHPAPDMIKWHSFAAIKRYSMQSEIIIFEIREPLIKAFWVDFVNSTAIIESFFSFQWFEKVMNLPKLPIRVSE